MMLTMYMDKKWKAQKISGTKPVLGDTSWGRGEKFSYVGALMLLHKADV